MKKKYSANIRHQIFISRWKSSLHYVDNRQMTTLGASMEHEYIVTWGSGGGRPVPLLALCPQVHDRRMAGVLIPNIHRPNSPPPPTQPFPSISIYKTISTNTVRGKTSNRIIKFGKKIPCIFNLMFCLCATTFGNGASPRAWNRSFAQRRNSHRILSSYFFFCFSFSVLCLGIDIHILLLCEHFYLCYTTYTAFFV